jgi:hypothetical protein
MISKGNAGQFSSLTKTSMAVSSIEEFKVSPNIHAINLRSI